jgi:serine/threonine protein kinase
MIECAVCATPVPDDSRFCPNCGSQMSDAEGQAAVSAAMDLNATQQMERLLRAATAADYELEGLLGRGGMAAVYLATERVIDRKVAIKVLPPELTFGHGIERFVREAKTAATLDHPNIIPIYRVSSEGSAIFWYVMKYLQGKSLEDQLKAEGVVPFDRTVEILRQVASALDYAHRQHVIHRDVKPANVMLDAHERVIVTDFGIAKPLSEGTITASGAVVGTPSYMSPEQGLGHELSGASDQYSLAVMAYEMIAGRRPFTGKSPIEILHQHCTATAPPLESVAPDVPRHAALAVRRALAKKAASRFTSADAFVRAFGGEGDVDESATLDRRGRPSWRSESTELITKAPAPRRRLAVTLAGFVLLGLVTVAGLLSVLSRGATDNAAPRAESLPVAPEVPAPKPVGHVTVGGLPADGTVSIDGEARQGTEFDLAAGRTYLFRLEAPGYRPMTDTVPVVANQATRLRFARERASQAAATPPEHRRTEAPTPTGSTSPPDVDMSRRAVVIVRTGTVSARIFVNKELIRDGRVARDTVLAGVAEIHVERDGYVAADTTVTLRPGQELIVDIVLRRVDQ